MSARFVALLAAALSFAGATPCAFGQVVYTTTLSGAAEVPPNASTGVGSATITYFPATSMMTVSTSFSGLSGVATAAHIHCCTSSTTNAGVATQTPNFDGFPIGIAAGTYEHTFGMTLSSSYNPAFVTASGGSVTAALQRLLEGMGNRTAYFNIHSMSFPGGELRGNLVEQSIFRSGFD
ncbi:CHRD domain-containing protein [Dokdonella sp.]|uniref:CHRD domain-containing protein n=1 Tax=Dokdonella sp. TaxID=2291710 RepID=UPI002BC64917|nr:CHRD domain-containing protein [Dokdonella sp.]HOY76998.1 CHRD domain-containing protein [Hyphomonadaceae bacterium]HPN80166.1 CHRD domain-containing protein [Dokdonella sp.]